MSVSRVGERTFTYHAVYGKRDRARLDRHGAVTLLLLGAYEGEGTPHLPILPSLAGHPYVHRPDIPRTGRDIRTTFSKETRLCIHLLPFS